MGIVQDVRAYVRDVFAARWALIDDPLKTFILPVAANLAILLAALILKDMRTDLPRLLPFVCASVIISNQICVRAGLWSGFLTMICYMALFHPEDVGWPARLEFFLPTVGEAAAFACMFVTILWVAPRAPRHPRPPQRGVNDTDPLPFTRRGNGPDEEASAGAVGSVHGTGSAYWDVLPTGDYGEECDVGTEYCSIMVDRGLRGLPIPAFSWILEDMIRAGRFTGIEAGFAQAMLNFALGRLPTRR